MNEPGAPPGALERVQLFLNGIDIAYAKFARAFVDAGVLVPAELRHVEEDEVTGIPKFALRHIKERAAGRHGGFAMHLTGHGGTAYQ